MLDKLIQAARKQGASDLHLEPGMPPALRVRGRLKTAGEPVSGKALGRLAREVVPPEQWPEFLARRSFDVSRVYAGVPCRLSLLQTARGVGFAIRLLATTAPSLAQLNLHPELAELARRRHGLVVVCGPTGSGKSSTLAALVETVNVERPAHVITIERPIEYHFRSQRAFIRQREVGRDTPSFEQALLDALREDPDVVVVGEMRHPVTIQRTLDAAETGHLVLATMHAASPVEALQRIISAFPPEAQAAVRAQLASALVAAVSQTLDYREDWQIRVPVCEVLVVNDAVRANLREGRLHLVGSAIETGARDGMWTRERYRRWLDQRTHFHVARDDEASAPAVTPPRPEEPLPPLRLVEAPATPPSASPTPAASKPSAHASSVIEIDDGPSVDDIIAELEKR